MEALTNRKTIILVIALGLSFISGCLVGAFLVPHKYPVPRGYLTFTLDDNRMGQYVNARPILEEAGFKATFYVTRDNFDKDPSFFGEVEVKALYNAGHEIGDHGKTHRDLADLTETEIKWEIGAEHLKAIGIHPRSHAYTYGTYNRTLIDLVSRYYDYARASDRETRMRIEAAPINPYTLNARVLEQATTVESVKSWIDEAITEEKWLIITFHNIVESPTEYTEYSISNFQEIVDYAKTKKITVRTLSEVADLLTLQSYNIGKTTTTGPYFCCCDLMLVKKTEKA